MSIWLIFDDVKFKHFVKVKLVKSPLYKSKYLYSQSIDSLWSVVNVVFPNDFLTKCFSIH